MSAATEAARIAALAAKMGPCLCGARQWKLGDHLVFLQPVLRECADDLHRDQHLGAAVLKCAACDHIELFLLKPTALAEAAR